MKYTKNILEKVKVMSFYVKQSFKKLRKYNEY